MSARGDAPRFGEFVWIGGDPVADFVNTATWRAGGRARERFGAFADVIAWADRALGAGPPDALLRYAAHHPRKAARALRRTIELRDILHALLGAAADGTPVPAAPLAEFNARLRWSCERARLGGSERLVWDWDGPANSLNRVLHLVIREAARLLTSEDVARLRRCANPECGRVFLDRSRKRNRRWCSLACGSRDKSRRYYARKRSRAAAAPARSTPGG